MIVGTKHTTTDAQNTDHAFRSSDGLRSWCAGLIEPCFIKDKRRFSKRRGRILPLRKQESFLEELLPTLDGGRSDSEESDGFEFPAPRNRDSLHSRYLKAAGQTRNVQRKRWAQLAFEYAGYLLLAVLVYFVLIGVPLWKGVPWAFYDAAKAVFNGLHGLGVVVGLAVLYSFIPLLVLFEKDPAPPKFDFETTPRGLSTSVRDTAVLIPCYKAAKILPATLKSALQTFPAENIFVIANGNSPTPLDDTQDVCQAFGVRHVWSSQGSKLLAQFVGCHAAHDFKHVLMIDDDCLLPANFPVVSDRITGRVKCIGYTIKSVGENSGRGTLCQRAQDLEYKLSGLQRTFTGVVGSCTFPHGAISLWDREFLLSTFRHHPGYSISEDWFMGNSCRWLGGRIKMCSAVFVETETPASICFASGASRGGFGEMTVFKQRFLRWNFFNVNCLWFNLCYLLFSWKLGWWEIGTKVFVFQEFYETLLYLTAPIVLPVSFLLNWRLSLILCAGVSGLYILNALVFNEIHLRLKKERVGLVVVLLYYPYCKLVLTFVNVASFYWAMWKYAKFFAKRHNKIVEDKSALELVLRLRVSGFESTYHTEKASRDAYAPFSGCKPNHTVLVDESAYFF